MTKFLVFSTHNLIGRGPHLQVSSMMFRSSTQGLQIWGKRADQNLGPFWSPGPLWLNLTKIFSLFNTQPNRPRASPASFKHVGRSSTQGASNLEKTGLSKFGSILASRSAVFEFDKNF